MSVATTSPLLVSRPGHALGKGILGIGCCTAFRQLLVKAVVNFSLAAIIILTGCGFRQPLFRSYTLLFAPLERKTSEVLGDL